MSIKKLKSRESIIKLRKSRNENQTEFWGRYGVTQSGGSRYEKGPNGIPVPLRMLISMHVDNVVSDSDLKKALAAAGS